MAKLVKLQILDSDRIKATETRRLMKKREISALRGEIRDRYGKPLAITYYKSRLILDPQEIKKPEVTVQVLAEILGKNKAWEKDITHRLVAKRQEKSRYFPLFSSLSYEIGSELHDRIKGRNRDYRLAGAHIEFIPERHYPKRWLGSHLVGFLNKYDDALSEGLERYYHDALAGEKGLREVLSDAHQNDLAIGGRILKKPLPGSHLELTIDENIQFLVENELQFGMNQHQADAVTCIVIEPQSGDVLAMANLPDFNPEHYGSPQRDREISRRNRAVEAQYEPASAFKIVTMAAALEQGKIDLDQRVYCENGSIAVYNRVIRDHKPFGNLSYREVLWYSSNVGAIKAAQQLEPQTFYDYIVAFGFGKKTQIDLPAEINGLLRPVKKWKKTSSSFLAIGHEIGATPLQMLMAANVIANGGYLVQPRVGKRLVKESGEVVSLGNERSKKKVLEPRTVAQIKEALLGVVSKGTAKKGALNGVQAFGKTGTAQRVTKTGYSDKDFNASFVGFFPYEKPRYGIIIVVYNPRRGGVHGGDVAAPIFKRIGEGILWYERSRQRTETSEVLHVSGPSAPQEKRAEVPIRLATEPQARHGQMPDVRGLGLKSALIKCAEAGVFPEIKGAGRVSSQYPEPGETLSEQAESWLLLRGGS